MPAQPQHQHQQQQALAQASGPADHDQPYRFGYQPNHQHPYPFNTRQYARLLVLRSRLHAGLVGPGDLTETQEHAWRIAAA